MMPLGELDVKDVKEHLRNQKESQDDYTEGNDFVLGSSAGFNPQLQAGVTDLNKKNREAREERLGLR
jgi:hypothetical protein